MRVLAAASTRPGVWSLVDMLGMNGQGVGPDVRGGRCGYSGCASLLAILSLRILPSAGFRLPANMLESVL
jgi:hypothetical protein